MTCCVSFVIENTMKKPIQLGQEKDNLHQKCHKIIIWTFLKQKNMVRSSKINLNLYSIFGIIVLKFQMNRYPKTKVKKQKPFCL